MQNGLTQSVIEKTRRITHGTPNQEPLHRLIDNYLYILDKVDARSVNRIYESKAWYTLVKQIDERGELYVVDDN